MDFHASAFTVMAVNTVKRGEAESELLPAEYWTNYWSILLDTQLQFIG